jgi:hypothetical protein
MTARLLSNLHDAWVLGFLERHAQQVVNAFGRVLKATSYRRRR